MEILINIESGLLFLNFGAKVLTEYKSKLYEDLLRRNEFRPH